MQFFPIDGISADNFADNPATSARTDGTQASAHADFNAVLRSFIEEDREDYSGRPAGFAAYDARPDAVDEKLRGLVKDELRKRSVSEEHLQRLDALTASGQPLTVSAMFNALAGRSRASAPLTEDEGNTLKGLLNKVGFDADGQAEIIALSDAGDVNGMWNRISAGLSGHKNAIGINREEFAALLKGFDLSQENAAFLAGRFKEQENEGFTGDSLRELLAPAMKETADRALASRRASQEMRAAVDEAMRRAKAGERYETVEDKRGSRLSEQSEALMQDSVRRRTGVDDVKDSARDGEEGAEERRERRNRPENMPRADGEKPGPQSQARSASARETATSPPPETFINALVPGREAAFSRDPLPATRAAAYSSEIFAQVEGGLLQGVQNGAQKLTLQLNPAELGAVTVVLSFHQGELRASLRAERAESAEVLTQQLAELRTRLEEQGIKVAELDVRASLSDNGSAGTWDGYGEHNLMRDSGERGRLIRLARMRRDETAAGSAAEPVRPGEGGLHLVA
ncbi:MAG: flagellar hook-length control protein FliK [Desulfovibrio sp.]|jgi:flagellar hook-length control protein FliK|nr:flagellar hook-length control protein FliK [Desulfovibrio sp.]